MRGRLTTTIILVALLLAGGTGSAAAAEAGIASETGAVLFQGGDVRTLFDRDTALFLILALIVPGMIALGVAATRQPRCEQE